MTHKIKLHGASKIGVLMINLGTPDATDYLSMRRYLEEFLSDRRVIETPKWIWWFILNFIILNTRPQKSGKLYEKIWDRKANDSPLRIIAASQAKKLASRLNSDKVLFDFAMRYGKPSIQARLNYLKDEGCERILLMPLYPQYSGSTSASVNDKIFEVLTSMRRQPSIRITPPYYDDPAYINSLAKSIACFVDNLEFVPDQLIVSYHGLPQSYVDAGDPYFDHCKETTRLLTAKLNWPEQKIIMAFQSRFGRSEWLKPYLENTLTQLPSSGIKNIAIIAPAFSVDCLETLEELAIGGQEIFLEAGGKNFAYIPCLNDSQNGLDVIEHIVRRELQGWITTFDI